MSSPADALEILIDELAHRVGAMVVARLRTAEPGMVDQAGSPLGNRRHCAAVKRRISHGEPGASIVGRAHWLTLEALSEELGRATRGKAPKAPQGAPSGAPQGSIRAELQRELQLVRGAK